VPLQHARRIMNHPVNVPISKRLVLINSVGNVVTRVLTVGVFAWAIQYLIKRIPADELAILPIVMSVAMVLPLLQIILVGGLARHVTEAFARNDLDGVTRIVSSQFPLLLASGLLTLFLGGAFAWNIHHVLNVPPDLVYSARLMTFLVVIRLAVGMAIAPFNVGVFARQRFILANVIEIAGSLLRIVLMVGLILGIGPNVVWVVVAQVVSLLFTQLTETAFSIRIMPALRFRPESFDWETSKVVLSFGGWQFLSQAANAILRAADAPILNLFSTPNAVNNFFLGSYAEVQLREIAHRATEPVVPALTAMHAHEQHSRLAAAYLRGGRIILWAHMFVALPLMVFSYDLFAVYLRSAFDQHIDAATVMLILLVGFPLTRPTLIFSRIAFAQGKIRPLAILSFNSQLANLALTLVLVGGLGMGAIGSAAASTITTFIAHPFFYWPLALRTLEISTQRFIRETLLPGLLPSLVATFTCYASTYFISSTITRLAVGLPVLMIVYAAVTTLVLKPADRADLDRIRQLMPI
jgi:O-antigen/teichoic acid export membrane protein